MQDTRAVYLESCAAIAAAFAPLGYKFAKSGPYFTAQSRDKRFAYSIGFSSSVYNIRGQHVAMSVSAGITSPLVKQWETALWARYGVAYQGGGGITGCQLTYLAPLAEKVPLSWELAHDDTRAAAISQIIDCVTRHALPWFAHCEDVPRLIEHIVQTGEYPMAYPRSRLPGRFPAEFMLCFASKEQTTRALAVNIKRSHSMGRANLYKNLAEARAESPLRIDWPGTFHGFPIRYLLAEGIEFPDEKSF